MMIYKEISLFAFIMDGEIHCMLLVSTAIISENIQQQSLFFCNTLSQKSGTVGYILL